MGDQDQDNVGRGLFESFEQRVGCFKAEAVRIVKKIDPPLSVKGRKREPFLQGPDLSDLNAGPFGSDLQIIRVGSPFEFPAGIALRLLFGSRRAQEGFREDPSDGPLPDALLAVKKISL